MELPIKYYLPVESVVEFSDRQMAEQTGQELHLQMKFIMYHQLHRIHAPEKRIYGMPEVENILVVQLMQPAPVILLMGC